ncbi:MAG: NAD-dependent epimerase/dehydratase family protein [Planctomycetaceae bacterium]
MSSLIIGCGYLGNRVAKRWLAKGREVVCLTRSASRAESLRQKGLLPLVGDVTQPDSLAPLGERNYETVLYAVGYDRTAGPSKRDVYLSGLQNVLEKVRRRGQRFIYISSTSVYGVSDGSWVDELTQTNPATESGEICLEAEEIVRQTFLDSKVSCSILRLAGIYGPDRLLRKVDQLRQ